MIQVKIAEWRAMTIVAEPTTTTGQIRKDSDGVNWESVVGGSKRTRTIKRVAKTVSVVQMLGSDWQWRTLLVQYASLEAAQEANPGQVLRVLPA